MEAIEIAGADGHFTLRSTQRPMPRPGPEEVLIRVRAAGVNGHDVHQVHRGSHPLDEGETDLPGLEVAGEIVEVGASVEESRAGDRVCALLRGGGYAEFAVAHQALCLPIPAGLDWVQAAALPEACFTVWSNVFIDGRLEPGESFLMNGGTSGIGVTAIHAAVRSDGFLGMRGLRPALPDMISSPLFSSRSGLRWWGAESSGW